MKKDKEWLKNNLERVLYNAELSGLFSTGITSSVNIVYDDVLTLINQLDEPELPMIPQFVADWIERNKQKRDKLIGVMLDFYVLGIDSDDINKYINENYETFARAWLDGYTIEKEPQWTVKLDNGRYVDNFIESITGVEVEVSHRLACTAPIRFKDKSKAEAVALLVNGEVVEVTNE